MALRTGVVDVGGGFRGIYASGVLDRCLDDAVHFDVGVGVSAGSANIASYGGNQYRRNYQFYTEFGMRWQYGSVRNFFRVGSYLDMNYIYGTLSNSDGESPLDYMALMANPMEYYVVATDANTGKAVYFDKSDMAQDRYDPLKASSSIPFVCKPYPIGGHLYYDGALGDPVPVEKAFSLGCDRVVVILTKPANVPREPGSDPKIAKRIQKKYPLAAKQMEKRADHYNEGVALAKKYAEEGRALIIAPDDTCGVSTLSKDVEAIKKLYQKGYNDGAAIKEFLTQS